VYNVFSSDINSTELEASTCNDLTPPPTWAGGSALDAKAAEGMIDRNIHAPI